MSRTLKALSALLLYPTPDLQEAAADLRAALAGESLLGVAERRALGRLVDEIASSDIYELQERYLLLFDRSRSLSLHLFEHVHGEGRDRGQAMVDLQALYRKAGLGIVAPELPDYLPLFLEFLSTRPLDEVRDLLGETAHILAALAERLEKRSSAYASVFAALLVIAPAPDQSAATEVLPEEDPADLAALDAAWEDKPVSFGPDALAGCHDDLIAKLRAARRRAPGSAAPPAAKTVTILGEEGHA